MFKGFCLVYFVGEIHIVFQYQGLSQGFEGRDVCQHVSVLRRRHTTILNDRDNLAILRSETTILVMFEKTFLLFSSRIKWNATSCKYLYNGRIPSKEYIISVFSYYRYQIITSFLLTYCIVSFLLLMTMSNWDLSENFIFPVSWSHSRVKSVQIITIDKFNYTNVRSSNSAFESWSFSKTRQVSLLPPWVEVWKLPTTSFTPQKFPILFFSNYRHAYFTKCLQSIRQSAEDIDNSTACIFVLQRTTKVSNADIEKTKAAIEKVNFCKKFVWEANKDGPASVLYAANYKKHWWKTVSKIFKREGVPFTK